MTITNTDRTSEELGERVKAGPGPEEGGLVR